MLIMSDLVTVEIEAHVATVRLVRPAKLNALNPAMFEGLLKAGERVRARPDVRCVVLTGEGRAFCAGIDMQRFENAVHATNELPPLAPRTHGIANLPQKVVIQWREMRMPVIAAVHGVAFGAGFQLALGADIRYVEPTARLSIMEIEWGLVPDMGGTVLMRSLARDDVIRELTYTGRIFSGEEALTYGFATKLCKDPLSLALKLAREIAAKSPSAIQAGKRLLNSRFDAALATDLLAESLARDDLVRHPNQREAAAARLSKRPAVFIDRN
jgi:enoyl-CoA hydratase/carnithine racemase